VKKCSLRSCAFCLELFNSGASWNLLGFAS